MPVLSKWHSNLQHKSMMDLIQAYIFDLHPRIDAQEKRIALKTPIKLYITQGFKGCF